MSRLYRSAPLVVPVVFFLGCSSELPTTKVLPWQVDGEDVLDDNGDVIRATHVKRNGEWVRCDDPELGARRLVADSEGKLFYAGQALMNQTCARGQCHSSAAEGELRSGAPAGLDFDLPLSPLVLDSMTNTLAPDPDVSLRLAVHQRSVYDKRDALWAEVDSGRMPPKGVGAGFREDPGLTFVTLGSQGGCTQGEDVGPITESDAKTELAVWLACGSPVIEASDEQVSDEVLGTVGNILPTCATLDPELPPTFESVYSEVLDPACASLCHNPDGIRPDSDYSTPQLAFDNLVNAAIEPTCSGAEMVYVVPNDPDASYLLHKMGDPALSDPFICPNTSIMPLGGQPLLSGIELIRRWIEAGAPGPGESAGGGGGGAADAGAEGGP